MFFGETQEKTFRGTPCQHSLLRVTQVVALSAFVAPSDGFCSQLGTIIFSTWRVKRNVRTAAQTEQPLPPAEPSGTHLALDPDRTHVFGFVGIDQCSIGFFDVPTNASRNWSHPDRTSHRLLTLKTRWKQCWRIKKVEVKNVKLTETEARTRFPILVVASLGAQRKDKPNGVVPSCVLLDGSCVLLDGTHGQAANTRTRIRDQERSPTSDLKRARLGQGNAVFCFLLPRMPRRTRPLSAGTTTAQ